MGHYPHRNVSANNMVQECVVPFSYPAPMAGVDGLD